MFNIILKLNNHTRKKLQNYCFVEINEAQSSGFVVAKKAPNLWKKFFLKKNFFQLICADMIFKTCGIFLNKWFSRYLSLGDFKVISILIVFQNKISNETRLTKSQENSAHRIGDNYLMNHLVKFLQDRIKPRRVGALTVCTDYNFFYRKIVSEGFLTSFNFSRGSC